MPLGIKDVAKLAGVSSATVSRVLSNGPVSAEARRKVEAAIRVTGYRPNLSARRLRSRHSRTIGLIVSDIRNSFFTALIHAVEAAAYQADMRVILCNTDENPTREAMYLRLMQEERVTGLIYSPTLAIDAQLDGMAFDFPVVMVDRPGPISAYDSVEIDNHQAAAQLVELLIANGYRRIAGLFGNTSATAIARHAGYLAAVAGAGLTPEPHFIAPNAGAASEALSSLCKRAEPPDAVVASNGLILLGVAQAAKAMGLAAPGDLAMAGFDNDAWTSLIEPGLTVIEQPMSEIGRTAMSLLFERLDFPDMAPRKITLSSRLIERGSTGPRAGDPRRVGEPVAR